MLNCFDAHIFGNFFSSQGIGVATRGYWKLLTAAGLKVGIWPQVRAIGEFELEIAREYEAFIVQGEHPKLNFFRINAQEIDSCPIMGMENSSANNILIPMWETSKLPEIWHRDVQRFTGIIAATSFIAEAFKIALRDKPTFIIPHPIDLSKENQNYSRSLDILQNQKYILYSFAYSSFCSRKQPEKFFDLSNMYGKDEMKEPVTFVLASGDKPRSDYDNQLSKLFKDSESNSFKYLEGPRDRNSHLNLMENATLFVSLHRSEGIGLQLAECALLNTPIVTHHYSGPGDFLDSGMPGKYEYHLKQIESDEYPGEPEGFWADFELQRVILAINRALTSDSSTHEITTEKVRAFFSLESNILSVQRMLTSFTHP
jgi:hypothetical protein